MLYGSSHQFGIHSTHARCAHGGVCGGVWVCCALFCALFEDSWRGFDCRANLKHLDVSSLAAKKSVNDAAMDALTLRCRALTRINLFGCWMITDLALKYLSERCAALQALNVGSCTHITDAGIRFIAEGCTHLLDLNLWRLDQVSDKGLQQIAERCTQLNVLVCSDTKFVTHAGLSKFAPTCKIYF